MPSDDPLFLLAEDNEDDLLLIERAFRKAGLPYRVRAVRDGEEAVDYLAGRGSYADRLAHPLPCVLLLDLKLPRRSGFEVLTWVRGQAGLRRLPVVVLTSSEQMADVNRAYDLGANTYLVKPATVEALRDLVRTLDLYWIAMSEKPDLSDREGAA
jgi:CheY-like chemotaxis protein